MGLPELTFTLKKAAETVSTRISRGAVALILRAKQTAYTSFARRAISRRRSARTISHTSSVR